jgi:uncharacterized protein YoxC
MNSGFVYVALGATALAAVVIAIYLILVLARVRALVDRLDGTAQYLEASRPKIDRILDNLEAELVELRSVSAKVNHIAGDAERVSTGVRLAVQPIIAEVSDLASTVRYVRAAAVAFRTGLSAWKGHNRSDGDEAVLEIETVEER